MKYQNYISWRVLSSGHQSKIHWTVASFIGNIILWMSELFKCFTLQQYHWQWDWFSHSSCHQLGCSSLQTPWLLPSHNTQAETKRMRRVSLNISNNVAKDYFKIDFSPQILKIKIFKSNYIVKHFYLSLFKVKCCRGISWKTIIFFISRDLFTAR